MIQFLMAHCLPKKLLVSQNLKFVFNVKIKDRILHKIVTRITQSTHCRLNNFRIFTVQQLLNFYFLTYLSIYVDEI